MNDHDTTDERRRWHAPLRLQLLMAGLLAMLASDGRWAPEERVK